MQYLDSIIIHNFKSFKHANIKFSKGFNCIVGANGSGKSNLCDSLLFALGESSLKRMRVPNTSLLINSFAKPKNDDGVKKAYVKITFGGDNPLEVSRIIKSNNKMGYKLNGKHATRQEVIEVLRAQRSEINDTNIIAQGEISSLVSLNSKERRELIDVAAGIKEFNDKKDIAMKELQKVEERANDARIVLGERKGFLEQLEKEKEDAEKYILLTETVKCISYTILKNSERQSESDFKTAAAALSAAEEKRKATNSGTAELTLTIEKISKDKEDLSKSLNERSVELSSANRLLEGINKEIAVKETESKSLKERLVEYDVQTGQSGKELKKLQEENASALRSIAIMKKELEEKEKHLSSKEVHSSENGNAAQISIIGRNQKRIDEFYQNEELLSKQLLQNRFEVEDIEKSIKAAREQISSKSTEYGSLLARIKEESAKISALKDSMEKIQKFSSSTEVQIQKQRKAMDENYSERVNIRERIAISGGASDRISDLLKRNIKDGFYGRAYELCSYDAKYDIAVNASAMSRLSYLVVDSAEIADESIKIIKAKQLGRASFIPINDIETARRDDRKNLDRLIDHIKFDRKFDAAFSYIFANTYIVKDIAEAKSIGFGKGRFVTLDGELVEQSGIISGGFSKSLQSPAILESRLRALEEQNKELDSELGRMNAQLEKSRKELAASQTDSFSSGVTIKHMQGIADSTNALIETANTRIKELGSKLLHAKKSGEDTESKRNSLLVELNKLRDENERIYELSGSDSVKQKGKQPDKTDLEMLKSLRAEVQQLKIKIAEISKEEEMKGVRISEINESVKSRHEEEKERRKRLAILDNDIIELGKRKSEIQQKAGKSDANSQELYRKIQELEAMLARHASERGKLQADLDKINREMIENETRKVQIQTRINDIKAELLSYQNTVAIKDVAMGELEAKRTIAKNDIERLGAVNLKAPEVYDAKKRDVDEASSKLLVLSNEKESIMGMINEIESKKLNIFNETLAEVNKNFGKLYGYVFDGNARLQLDNEKDIFNSGLSLIINSPKNRNNMVEALSGGEKTLVMMMLIFAIQTHNPMSFYIFDEIDFSLDKENSKKLSKLMKEISKRSQVIVISHNDSLITATDTAIGVVHRAGESRVVGLQLNPTQNITNS